MWAAGFYCIVAGCVMAALAAVPGVIDLFSVVPPASSARQRGYIHGLLNSTALLLFIAIAAYRGGSSVMPNNLSLFLSAVGVGGIAITRLALTTAMPAPASLKNAQWKAGKSRLPTSVSWPTAR